MIDASDQIKAVLTELQKAIIGKEDALAKILMAFLTGGHILIDDIPGVGKTTISLAFAKVLGLKQKRLQMTPDILPSDITGFSIYDRSSGKFHYVEGAAMTNILLADELNRTSPRTQSALLEVMEEGQVTVDTVTRQVPRPFIVIATQNPTGSIGTQELPESQVDRFLIRISLGYPTVAEEVKILQAIHEDSLSKIKNILKPEELLLLQQKTCAVYVADSIYEYIARLANVTRNHPAVILGISPRGSIATIKMAQAHALFAGRDFVQPDDVTAVLKPVLLHRLIFKGKAGFDTQLAEASFMDLVHSVPLPTLVEHEK